MCLNIYIGSEKRLPAISWNEESPGFYIDELFDEKVVEMVHPILGTNYYYDVGSFMGCCCGFSFGKWSKESSDNHEQRIESLRELKAYLHKHLKDNEIKLFCTNWESFPDTYPIETFSSSIEILDEFEFADNFILSVSE